MVKQALFWQEPFLRVGANSKIKAPNPAQLNQPQLSFSPGQKLLGGRLLSSHMFFSHLNLRDLNRVNANRLHYSR